MEDEFDIYPILHKGKLYNLITRSDISFVEVRQLIDHLENLMAFTVTEEDRFMGPGKLFSFSLADYFYEVDVQGYEIVIYRREGIS